MSSFLKVPDLAEEDVKFGLEAAKNSPRHRYAKILHESGDQFNHVFNFMLPDSYMQTHLHPGPEKIESIYIVRGSVAVIYFDDSGVITDITVLGPTGVPSISVPAYKWHTYVVLSDYAITYETMMGIYKPETWKSMAIWAPEESTAGSKGYLSALKSSTKFATR